MGAPPAVAVAGCGAWGRNHVRAFRTLGALAAVSDAAPAAAEAAAAAAGVPARPWAEILADPAIAAVVIATPDALHADMARAALAAGKHALVEKPMAMTVAEAEALAAEARARKLVLMTGHILRFHAGFRRLLDLLREGAIGRARHIAARRLHYSAGAPRHALWDLGPHDLSMILAIAGGLPVSVRAFYSATADGVPQAGTVALAFADGLSAEITYSGISPVKLHQLTVAGEDAQVVFEDSKPWPDKLALYRPGLVAPRVAPARHAVTLTAGEPLAEEARAFLAAIAGAVTPLSGADEAIAVIRVLAAAARAAESGAEERP